VKWTNFSGEIVRHCKELIFGMEQNGIKQFGVGQGQPLRNVENVKAKIMKYDNFLANNIKELSAKGINMQVPRQ
jgi:predicted translin family RNA/ssDNA-binding protein